MGTPAFPNLGKHCSASDCQLLDFLPFTCDACNQVFCLDHRSYGSHHCSVGNKHDVTVVICPLCAKGVRLMPDENPNITWESHVNTECDPSNYEKVTKKKKCPVPGCKEILTFSNKVKCRDCSIENCLKHRFGLDHKCPGPKKQEASYQFMNMFSASRKEEPRKAPITSSSKWKTNLLNAASSFRSTAGAGMTKLSKDMNQAFSWNGEGQSSNNRHGNSGNVSGQVEQCPQCNLRFSSVQTLIEHVQRVHERNGVMNVTLDVCPKCSKGFRGPVALVEHVERDHAGMSR